MRALTKFLGLLLCVVSNMLADDSVEFPDPRLEDVVRSALNKPTGPLTSNDLAGLASLQAHFRGITNLAGLEAATNLNFLDLYSNDVSDLSPLLHLTSLEILNLGGNRITNVSGVGALWNLNTLLLGGSPEWFGAENAGIADLRPLSGLTNLQTLGVGGNHLRDASMSNLPALQFLDVGYCKLTNISFATNFPNLVQLGVHGNRLTDIAAVAGLTNLKWFFARENLLTNIPPLHTFNSPFVSVGLEYNFIDLNQGSPGRQIILNLLTNGVSVEHGGQTYSPRLTLVLTNSTSSSASGYLEFYGDSWSRYEVQETVIPLNFGFWGWVVEVHGGSLHSTRIPVSLAGPGTFFRLVRTELGVLP